MMQPCQRPSCQGVGEYSSTYPGMPGTDSPTTNWWQSLITGAAETAENVLMQRNLAKGVYTKTTPQGTVTYVQPAGTNANVFGASDTGISGTASASPGMGIVLIGGAALLLVFMLAKGR